MVELLISSISTKSNFFTRYEADDMNPTRLTATYYLPLQLKLSFYCSFYHAKKVLLETIHTKLQISI